MKTLALLLLDVILTVLGHRSLRARLFPQRPNTLELIHRGIPWRRTVVPGRDRRMVTISYRGVTRQVEVHSGDWPKAATTVPMMYRGMPVYDAFVADNLNDDNLPD